MSEDQAIFFPVSKGILDPKHNELTSCPLGLFLFLIDRTTKEVNGEGIVLGGKPMTYEEIGSLIGSSPRNIRRWAIFLRSRKYIKTEPTNKNGVLKWFVYKTKKFKTKNKTECPKMDTPSKTGWPKMDSRVAKNGQTAYQKWPDGIPKMATPIRDKERQSRDKEENGTAFSEKNKKQLTQQSAHCEGTQVSQSISGAAAPSENYKIKISREVSARAAADHAAAVQRAREKNGN